MTGIRSIAAIFLGFKSKVVNGFSVVFTISFSIFSLGFFEEKSSLLVVLNLSILLFRHFFIFMPKNKNKSIIK